jgi:glycosyltransferase involved in cell wall biosynthesis
MSELPISIIVPVYNDEKNLPRCIDSILSQTFENFECLIIDDSSTDNSSVLCDKYAEKDRRIKIIHNVITNGSSISRRVGLDNASGTYIQFVDSDDWIERNTLERLYSTAISNKYDIVWQDFFENKDKYQIQEIKLLEKIYIYKLLFDFESKISSALWNKFIKREILLQVNFPKSMMWEDLVIIIQSINKSTRIKYLPEAFYHHIINPNSITQTKERKNKGLEEIIENLSVTIEYLREYLEQEFIHLEPELSACVNRFKFESLFIKRLYNSNLFLQLYPESNNNIFKKTWKTKFYKRLFLYAYIKKLPGVSFFINLIRCVKY